MGTVRNEGEQDGFEKEAVRRNDTAVSRYIASVSGAGKDGAGGNVGGPGQSQP